jgi:glucose-1-phosphatase
MPVSTVLFDVGDVVCRFRPARRLAALAAASPYPAETIQAQIWDSGFDADCDRGHYTGDEIVARINDLLDPRLSADELRAIWALAFEPNEDVLAVADAVAPRVRTALFSNNGPLLYDALPTLFPTIWNRFDPRFFSSNLGASKPDPAIYAAAQAQLAAPSESLLLIDDSLPAVMGACAAGWQAIHFVGQEDLLERVLEHLA